VANYVQCTYPKYSLSVYEVLLQYMYLQTPYEIRPRHKEINMGE